MTDDVLGRISGDLAIVRRAMGLHLFFGKEMLVFNIVMAVAAMGAAVLSRSIESDWLQQVPFAAVMGLVPVGLYLRSRRTSHEINLQVLMSVCIYAVVWIAACGYMMATVVGPTLGAERSALLYATSITFLLAFTVILVRAALKSREQHYCLGLALSTCLAGMLLPILGQNFSYSLAHGLMAIGYLTGFTIQWAQLREVGADHAAD